MTNEQPKDNNPDDFFKEFFKSFNRFFNNGNFPTFDWNNPEFLEKLQNEGKAFFGYSSFMGPDGKPIIKTWGNMNPSNFNLSGSSEGAALINGSDDDFREPFIDIIEDANEIKILAELPGTKKEDIELKAKHDGLKLTAGRFAKFITIKKEFDPESISAHYNNGVLEIRVTIVNNQEEDNGFKINVN